MTLDKNRLIQSAKEAANVSYSPYSHFRVGAALLCRDDTIIKGTNVENRSYGLTICAERVSLFSAISQGKRDFTAIAVYSPDYENPLPPCGACRQVLSEFVKEDFLVIMAGKEKVEEKTIAELLPFDSLHDFFL
ncbi:MAG: cytidine deaminase [Spirochaetales bacterium]|nr:cytidine deaminase [Spirochaetales bacterium]